MTIGRLLRRISLLTLVVVLAAAPFWAPGALRQISWFEVDRVSISGVTLLDPYDVLVTSGITADDNVWDDLAHWEAALTRHAGIASAEIERHLPEALYIRIQEKLPVAYVEIGTLKAVTGSGEILPVDPTTTPVDLPIVRANSWEETLVLLAETERLSRLDPGLLSRVSEITFGTSGGLLLRLAIPRTEVVLPTGSDLYRLRQLQIVLADLDQRSAGGEDVRHRVDLRFADQIVVRTLSSV